jgi:pimeloyl-ACP methyl ester carboxylesterase
MRLAERAAGAMRVTDWSFPVPPVQREVLNREPTEPVPGRPPLLFVHGLAHAAWCWEPWLEQAAADGWSAHALSLRAHGGSGGRERRVRVSLREYVHDVLQEAVRLPRPPVLVAHSLGCVVASKVIARYPVAAAVLLTPIGVTHGLGTLVHNAGRNPRHVARMVAGQPVRLTSDDLFHDLDADSCAEHVGRLDDEPPIVQYQLAFHGPPGRPVGNPPVLVVGADRDTLVPRVDVERTAAYYGTSVRWLPDIGHDVMLDRGQEDAWAQVLADLTEALPPS